MLSIAESGCLDEINVDTIRIAAGLSRGSFYNYFHTVDSLLLHVSQAIGAQINAEQLAFFGGRDDPVLRLCCSLRYFVERAASERSCALLLLRTLPQMGAVSEYMRATMISTFTKAADRGSIDVPSVSSAVDFGLGVLAAMLRTSVFDGLNSERIKAEAAMLLRAYGLSKAKATAMANRQLPTPPETRLQDAILAQGIT